MSKSSRPKILSIGFLFIATIGSLVIGIICTFAPLFAQIALLGSYVSILAAFVFTFLEREAVMEQVANSGCSHGSDELKLAWRGISKLGEDILRLTHSPKLQKFFLAARSANLAKLSAEAQFFVCRKVLVTDLTWPRYLKAIRAEAELTSSELHFVPLRKQILQDKISSNEIVDQIATAFIEYSCDGIFLTAVSSNGLRVPVDRVFEAIEISDKVRFSIVDGAQEFQRCHPPLSLSHCDFYLFGAHKWLGSNLPLAIGLYGRNRSASFIETTFQRHVDAGLIQDPLAVFAQRLYERDNVRVDETINLLPLFAAAGAICDAPFGIHKQQALFSDRRTNLSTLSEIISDTLYSDN